MREATEQGGVRCYKYVNKKQKKKTEKGLYFYFFFPMLFALIHLYYVY